MVGVRVGVKVGEAVAVGLGVEVGVNVGVMDGRAVGRGDNVSVGEDVLVDDAIGAVVQAVINSNPIKAKKDLIILMSLFIFDRC
jgi:hypothetical protein